MISIDKFTWNFFFKICLHQLELQNILGAFSRDETKILEEAFVTLRKRRKANEKALR